MPLGQMEKTKYPGVYRRKDGRLIIRFTARLPGGRFTQKTTLLPVGIDLEAARRRAAIVRDNVHERAETLKAGQAASPPPPAPTNYTESFREYVRRWEAQKAARTKRGTQQRYHEALRDHILPRLGDVKVNEIGRAEIEAWVAWVERGKTSKGRKYTKPTLVGWWRLLTLVLRDLAADIGGSDPTVRVRPPESAEAARREARVLTEAELHLFLESVRLCAPHRHVEFLTMALTGARAGEVYALKWDAVDFDRGEIVIRRGISGGTLSETTKTRTPRTVPLHEILAEALKEHRVAMMAACHPGLKGNWVFPTDSGTMRLPQSAGKVFDLAREHSKIEQRITPQVLRRTFNSLLVKGGVDRIVLRSIVGHHDERMTALYTGVDLADKQAAVVSIFGGKRGG